ncbi:RNA-guided endonuclease TnpB family protein [Streptomyces sp. NPDC048342]|uniref:RNA-guided endonuclease InsQ/TnpB family protein n=1 Tax=unclassified Streptomyces TaxID=2593676 RepID=UPI003434F959
MQLRYSFRLRPDASQRLALARAFGCARVVFNDAVRAREDARRAGQPFPTAAQLSRKLITEAKRTVERCWLGEVSAVVLQQSLRDAEQAHRNFFVSLKGTRKGPRIGPPRFKSRKDARQSVRFTANARWSITGDGRLNLPEDLSVAGLARTKLAKSVHDAGWASFISMLEYKAERYGRTLVKIGRFTPTSQTCSACGVKDGPKPLNVREWTCSACGTVHDRDHNAAINVKTAAGLAVSACGAPVRTGVIPAQREETGSHGFPTEPCTA